jgi:tetratricopeptide (TPR) repeat protein
MFRAIASVLMALALIAQSSFAQEKDWWTQANEEYAAGHFREAADLYQKVVNSGQTNAAVFYNLGNARFRMGEFGQAILNYERALALEQQHPEALANLRLVRDKARALELKRNALESWAAYGTTTQYTIGLAVAAWIAIFALAGIIFAQRRSALRGVVFALALLAAIAAAAGLYARETGPSGRDLAIVTAKGTDARLATADNAGTVLTLPPGSEIKILSTRGDWMYAALPNDLRGWIPAKSAERVRL